MGKLHELLAVEADREGNYKRVRDEAVITFTKKMDHFIGQIRRLAMFDEADQNLNTEERKELVTTVDDKLTYVQDSLQEYLDVVLQKEATNQEAVADLIVEDKTIATALPATFLLGLETKLKLLRAMYEAIPTLDPGIKWEQDPSQGDNIFITVHPEKKFKTAKKFKYQVLIQPTKEHPAQIEKWEEQVPVGEYTQILWSGKVSPARKSELIGRIDKLIQGAKVARMKANMVDVKEREIGKTLCDYINE